MTDHPTSTARTQRRRRAIVVGLVLAAVLLVMAGGIRAFVTGPGNAYAPPSGVAPPGVPGPSAPPTDGRPEPFEDADAAMAQMVDTHMRWHTPASLTVDTTADLGLSIGDSPALRREIEANLPDTAPGSNRPIRVGTDVTAVLVGDPDDVQITPDAPIDASTGSDVALLWTRIVRPRRPADELRLVAKLSMRVPGTDHRLTHDVPVSLPVHRTWGYTAGQLFTNWPTLAAVGASVATAVAWLRRRRRSASSTALPDAAQPTDPPDSPSSTTRVTARS
ncbi:MAG: hypothetical protein ACRCYR_03910 [Phycicoccus sp.]